MTEIVQNQQANSDIECHILLTSMPVFGATFAAKIKCTARHWIVLRKENKKIGVVGGGGGHERLSVP